MPSTIADGTASIELNDREHTLRQLLLDVADWVKQQDGKKKASELRFTGGWVRDKLLNVGSHDIDVAIDDMTGLDFGLRLKDYLLVPGHAEKYGLVGLDSDKVATKPGVDKTKLVHGLHKIQANPEKSKNLETATTKVLGLDIDLVNLRKEAYNEDSRNPVVEFADTPEEDAYRRDATVNAMFYNLRTEAVEDLTGKGLDDMQNRVIRTPLEPYQTFRDDPLRVLRLIRFASRLGYTIDQAAKEAMRDQTIKDTLRKKISRERVGVELEKMLKGPDPLMALSTIDEVGLYNDVFCVPPPQANEKPTPAHTFALETNFVPDSSSWRVAYETVRSLLANETCCKVLVQDAEAQYLCWTLACFVPFVDAPEAEHKQGSKPQPPIASTVARQGIKATNQVSELVTASVQNAEDILAIKDAFIRARRPGQKRTSDQDVTARDTLGNAIRRWGKTWKMQAVYALMLDAGKAASSGRDFYAEWSTFLKHLEYLDLLEAYSIKPAINGQELAKALNTRPGTWMKDALDVVVSWQLRNPESATKEGAIEAVQAWKRSKTPEQQENGDGRATSNQAAGELTATLLHHFLTLTIRPLFSKTSTNHHSSITCGGRARQTLHKDQTASLPQRDPGFEDEVTTRPWKRGKNHYALDLLRWCVRSLTPPLAEKEWPLLIPPILALLDDVDTQHKALGLEILSDLLSATTPQLLKRTGLAEVFHDAIKPALYYLPTLTPEEESVRLLNVAYPAMFELLRVQYPAPRTEDVDGSLSPLSDEKTEALIRLLHDHLLRSFTFISPYSNYSTLTKEILHHIRTVVTDLDIDTISQLIHLVPLLRDVLARTPFMASTSEGLACMAEAARCLGDVIRMAWMRMKIWRGEVISALAGGWTRMLEETENNESLAAAVHGAAEELKMTAKLLVSAVEATWHVEFDDEKMVTRMPQHAGQPAGEGFRQELREVVEADDRLELLFEGLLVDSE